MSPLPDTVRVLLGPGPSLTAPRVMRAMAAPTLSHLDPQMMQLLDDVRARLTRLFEAEAGSFAFAVSGTGTSGMETVVANLDEALSIIEEEGLDTRWARHERNHLLLIDALAGLGLTLLPREGERLWTLNAVRVPDGVDDPAVRKHLLDEFNIEIGAGLGPLAGKVWRVGLMGASSSPGLIVLLRGALEGALVTQGRHAHV